MKKEGMINAERRPHGSSAANKRLRNDGFLPGNIYGKGMESIAISVRKDELGKSLARFGRNAVFKLNLTGDKTYDVVIREIQDHPVQGGVLHVDFQKISLSEETKTDVIIKIIGDDEINLQRFILQQQMDSIPVKGLPQNIPDSIKIDVTGMRPGQSVTIGSIKLPKGIVCELDPEHVVLTVKESNLQKTLTEAGEAVAEAPAE